MGAYVGAVVGASEGVLLVQAGLAVEVVLAGSLIYAVIGILFGFCVGGSWSSLPVDPFSRPGTGAAVALLGTSGLFIVLLLGLIPTPPQGPILQKVKDIVCLVIVAVALLALLVSVLAPRFGEDIRRSAAMPVFTIVLEVVVISACIVLDVQPRALHCDERAFETVLELPDELRDRPNTLYVVVHGLRRDAVGVYAPPGAPPHASLTPRLDRFSRESIVFDQAVAASSATGPAVASLFTGLDVGGHRVRKDGTTLRPTVTTLFEAQRDQGFHTAAIHAQSESIGAKLGFDQGFEHYLTPCATSAGPREFDVARLRLVRLLVVVVAELRTFRSPIRPQLSPRQLPPPHFEPLPSTSIPTPRTPGGRFSPREPVATGDKPGAPGPVLDLGVRYLAAKRHTRWSLVLHVGIPYPHPNPYPNQPDRAYSEGVQELDRLLGGFFDQVQRLGLYRDTLVVVTADHGAEFVGDEICACGESLYDDVLLIPLMMKMPGSVYGGTRYWGQVRGFDAFVTAASLQGARIPSAVPTLSAIPGHAASKERSLLADLVWNSKLPADECMKRQFSRRRQVYAEVDTGSTRIRAWRSRLFKYVFVEGDNPRGQPTEQFYDVLLDPYEEKNLAELDRVVCGKNLASLKREMKSLFPGGPGTGGGRRQEPRGRLEWSRGGGTNKAGK